MHRLRSQDVDDGYQHSNHQQQVNQCARQVKASPKQPQNEQNRENQRGLPAPKKKRLVNKPMSRSSAKATNALSAPIAAANSAIDATHGVVVKSPSLSDTSASSAPRAGFHPLPGRDLSSRLRSEATSHPPSGVHRVREPPDQSSGTSRTQPPSEVNAQSFIGFDSMTPPYATAWRRQEIRARQLVASRTRLLGEVCLRLPPAPGCVAPRPWSADAWRSTAAPASTPARWRPRRSRYRTSRSPGVVARS